MPPILNAQKLSKSYGANPLFQDVSFTVQEGDRVGLIGPNGSGKSTLMRVLAGSVSPDSGEVVLRKHTRLSYVEQESRFEPGMFRSLFWIIWYPLAFWALSALTAAIALPRAALRPRQGRTTWVSPDRGLR